MKIAIFTDTFPPQINGVATSTYNLRNVLIAHGHQVLIVAPNFDETKFEYKDGIVKIPGILLKRLYDYRGTWIYSNRAIQIIKDFKPDVIHCQDDAPVGIFSRIAARKLNIPFIYTYHTQYEDYTEIVTHGYFDRVAKKTIRNYSITLSKFAQEFITPSEKTKSMLRHYGADNYISVIPTGIDFSLFKLENLDPNEFITLKKNLKIDNDTFTFLLLGRLSIEKSMDVSIKYFADFVAAHPEIKSRLIVVGGGPNKHNLEMLAEKLNISEKVCFVGPVLAEKVPYYYHLANVYTSASLSETQGLTFMEAMASECLVLARFDNNLAGTLEDNETGFYFTDSESFIEKSYNIYKMDEKEHKRLTDNAKAIIKRYSIETFYNAIMEVYQRGIKSFW